MHLLISVSSHVWERMFLHQCVRAAFTTVYGSDLPNTAIDEIKLENNEHNTGNVDIDLSALNKSLFVVVFLTQPKYSPIPKDTPKDPANIP